MVINWPLYNSVRVAFPSQPSPNLLSGSPLRFYYFCKARAQGVSAVPWRLCIYLAYLQYFMNLAGIAQPATFDEPHMATPCTPEGREAIMQESIQHPRRRRLRLQPERQFAMLKISPPPRRGLNTSFRRLSSPLELDSSKCRIGAKRRLRNALRQSACSPQPALLLFGSERFLLPPAAAQR